MYKIPLFIILKCSKVQRIQFIVNASNWDFGTSVILHKYTLGNELKIIIYQSIQNKVLTNNDTGY